MARRAGIPFQAIESGQVRGMAPWVAARNLFKAAKGSRQARKVMAEFRPDVVFVTGGYVAGPVVLAASRIGLPVFIYLPDVEPGLAIQRMSRFARKVGVTFPEVARYFPGKAVVTGYPVRPDILGLGRPKAMARQRLSLSQEEPVLLVFGGSRGARSINQALAAALPELLPRCQVVHISGTLDWPEVEACYAEPAAAAAAALSRLSVSARRNAAGSGRGRSSGRPCWRIHLGRVSCPGPAQHPGAVSLFRAASGQKRSLSGRPRCGDQAGGCRVEHPAGAGDPWASGQTQRLWRSWHKPPRRWPIPLLPPPLLANSLHWHKMLETDAGPGQSRDRQAGH